MTPKDFALYQQSKLKKQAEEDNAQNSTLELPALQESTQQEIPESNEKLRFMLLKKKLGLI